MKRNNKKGFTIVELVIVIAVIAILAGVLIPTFAGIITKAQNSAALQQASAAHKVLIGELMDEKNPNLADDGTYYFIVDGKKWFKLDENGVVVTATAQTETLDMNDKLYANAENATIPATLSQPDPAIGIKVIKDLNNVVVWLDAN